MKAFNLIFIILGAVHYNVFCQCPESGLKIQSAACRNVNSLQVDSLTCSFLRVKWQGVNNQFYKVKAIFINPITKQTYEIEGLEPSCDFTGRCFATIPVKEGMNVKWSVQGVCMEGNSILYGYESDGEEVSIPFCKQISNVTSRKLHIYPNPTNDDLTVEYKGTVTANTKFTVVDVLGKEAFSKSGDAITKTGSGYKLNLQGLFSGTYFLRITNGKEVGQARFSFFIK